MNSTCSFPLIIRRRLATLRRIRPASCVWGVTWGCPLPLTTHRRPVCFNEFPARSPLSYFRIGVKSLDRVAVSRELNSAHIGLSSSGMNGLHLCHAAIHEQFRSRDVATVVACEKHHGLGDLIGRTEPAERNTGGNHLQAFLARP